MLQPRGGKLTPQALRGARRRSRRARTKPRPMPVRKPPTCAKNATPTSGWRNDSTPSTACNANQTPSRIQAGTETTGKMTPSVKTLSTRACSAPISCCIRTPESVFDVVAEDPQVQHVEDPVEPAAVAEHAGKERRPPRHAVGRRHVEAVGQLEGPGAGLGV